jgi:hypothetical protein
MFAVGQVAFTVAVVVMFNVLQPVGWTLGLLRVQDVAMGCAVSLVVGVLFWPSSVGHGRAAPPRLAAVVRNPAGYPPRPGTLPPDTLAAELTVVLRPMGRQGHEWPGGAGMLALLAARHRATVT